MVSRPLSSKIAKRIGRPLTHDGVSGASIPASLTQLLFPGNVSPYYTEEEWPGYSYRLKDFSTGVGDLRDKRGARCYLFDGVNDYLAIASLVGTETVVSSSGTAVPTISAGRIDFTSGTCWNLQISNGSIYPCQEERGTVAYDIGPNALHGTITNATLGTFHSTNSAVDISYPNTYGYRLSSGVYIPKRFNSDLAADGNALTVTGRCPNYGLIKDFAWQGNGAAAYVSLTGDESKFSVTAAHSGILLFKTGADIGTPMNILSTRVGTNDRMSIQTQSAILRTSYFNGSAVNKSSSILVNTWYLLEWSWSGSSLTLTVNDVEATGASGTTLPSTQGAWLFATNGTSQFSTACIAYLSVTTGGVTTSYHPVPGTRDIAKFVDGVASVLDDAVVGGTLGSLYAEGPGTWQSPAVIYGGNWDGTGLYPAIAPLNVSANKAPITLDVDRTGGTVSPADYATNRDGYTAEEFDDVPGDNTVNKRLIETYASDRYGSAAVGISSNSYFGT